MPSPLGHTLAGLAVGWLAEPTPPARDAAAGPSGPLRDLLPPFVVWCVVAAAVPDADLLIPHAHRTATHSVSATVLIFILATVVTGQVTRARWSSRLVWAVAVAHATHLLLDWLGVDHFTDPGIQLLWPFSDRFFISGFDVFPPVERRIMRPEALGVNATAAFAELAIMGPIAAAAWLVRRRRRNRAPISGPGARRPPSA